MNVLVNKGETTEYYDAFCSRGGKDFRTNLQMRIKLAETAKDSSDRQHELWMMCSRDLLFYINAFLWIYEPRDGVKLPFVTWDFQDETLLALQESIGKYDVVGEKSRDMGFSWMCIATMEHRAHFFSNQTFGMYSLKAEAVDKSGDPKSLFWKLDHIQNNLPRWLKPEAHRTEMHVDFPNGSSVHGEGITKTTTVGGRFTALLFDEFGTVTEGADIAMRSRDTTRTRWFISTANGTGNKFYEIRQEAVRQKELCLTGKIAKPAIRLITLLWTRHPKKAEGLYYNEQGKARSPAYDRELLRCGNPREMAQEWDIDYAAAGYQFFSQDKIEEQLKQCRPPELCGDLDMDKLDQPVVFLEREKGCLQLWVDNDFFLDEHGNPPGDREYSIGVDVSVGTGNSNSAISVTDKSTNRKVGAYANANISEYELARLAVGIARWFKGKKGDGGYLIWERNGPGTSFGNEILKLGYRNIYYQEIDEKSVDKRYSDKPGWPPTREGKRSLLSELRRAEAAGEWTNQCIESNRERQHYVMLTNGAVAHSGTVRTDDPTGASANHGDRVIADALSWKGCKEIPYKAPPPKAEEFPYDSFGWRMQERRKKRMREDDEVYADA